jgi:hypothetical protein
VAIAGIVLGHWLVTAIVFGQDGALRVASPLATMPGLEPLTWLLQTLGPVFLAAGFAAARSGSAATSSGQARMARLYHPVATLVGLLAVTLSVGAVAGVPSTTLGTVATLALSPLWFLLPYLALTALTRVITTVIRRAGPAPLVAAAVAVVAGADLGAGLLPLTVCAAWLVPYSLGVALAEGRLGGRGTRWALLVGGTAAVVALVAAGYPGSAVGMPGAGRSNLNPPSLACVALAIAQAGAVVLALPWLRRHPNRAVGAVNRAALPIYLWHQVALLVVTVAMAWLAGGRPLTGLHTEPGAGWLAARAAWLVPFAATLALLVAPRLTRTWRVDPSQVGQPFSGRAALLSPFDRLIHYRRRRRQGHDRGGAPRDQGPGSLARTGPHMARLSKPRLSKPGLSKPVLSKPRLSKRRSR